MQLQVFIGVQQLDHIIGSQQVQTRDRPIRGTHHSECLSRASLPVGKAGGLGPFEGLTDQGKHAFLVDVCVGGLIVEGIIEGEVVLLDELGEIYFLPIFKIFKWGNIQWLLEFLDDQGGVVEDVHHV